MLGSENPISRRPGRLWRIILGMEFRQRPVARFAVRIAGSLLAAWVSSGCSERQAARLTEMATAQMARTAGPYVRVLGTVQDGGLPHAACSCRRCGLARRDRAYRRYVASLALVIPTTGQVVLIDATPDVVEQLDLLDDVRDAVHGRVDRAPVDGVLLTHAHVGHYLGLAFFGFEAVHTRGLPVYCTPRMASFLNANGPWSQLVEIGNIDLVEIPPGGSAELGAGVVAEFLRVPHRDEFSDTVGFVLKGPRRRLLYVPDTDAWESWEPPLTDVLQGIEVAVLDGSFYSLDELPGRDISQVKHPLITSSMDLLQDFVSSGRGEVYFSHMNHTNPALEPDSAARREIEQRGFHVLVEGQELAL